jgi:hypothetical protein
LQTIPLPSQVIFCLEIEIIFMIFTSLKCFDFFEKMSAYAVKIIVWLIFVLIIGEFNV